MTSYYNWEDYEKKQKEELKSFEENQKLIKSLKGERK